MKRFRFQLDTVLEYKQQVLDSRLVEHAAVLQQLAHQEKVYRSALGRRESYEEEYRQKKAEGLSIVDILQFEDCLAALLRQERLELERLRRLELQEEEKRQRVVETRTETATLEKLKSIKRQEYDKALAKEEERFIDDLTAAKRVGGSVTAVGNA